MSIYQKQNRFAQPGACYALNLDFFEMEEHSHNRCELMYMVKGQCVIYIKEEKLILKDRQFVFLDQNIPHRLEIEGEMCTLLNLEFECHIQPIGVDLTQLSKKSEPFADFLQYKRDYIVYSDNKNVGFSLKDLIFEMEKKELDNSYLLEILFIRFLLEISRCSEREHTSTGLIYVKKAKAFIHENLYEELSVARVADWVGVNHSYLQTLFSAEMNCGIMTYINRLRMDRATFLLKNSSMSIIDIAFRVGFNSRQHFGYTFEKQFGMSPKQYRKLNGQNIHADTNGSQLIMDADGEYERIRLLRTEKSNIVT